MCEEHSLGWEFFFCFFLFFTHSAGGTVGTGRATVHHELAATTGSLAFAVATRFQSRIAAEFTPAFMSVIPSGLPARLSP